MRGACIASFAMLRWSCIFSERGTAENFSWCPSRPFLLTQAEAEAWLSLLGVSLLLVPICHPSSPELDSWCIHEVFASESSCHCDP